jgi:hypothetical protein
MRDQNELDRSRASRHRRARTLDRYIHIYLDREAGMEMEAGLELREG